MYPELEGVEDKDTLKEIVKLTDKNLPITKVARNIDFEFYWKEKCEIDKWEDYDMGGERFQQALSPRRFPTDEICEADGQDKLTGFPWSIEAAAFVNDCFGHFDWLYREQVFWLANASPNALEDLTRDVYDGILADPARRAMIPVDYRDFVYGT